MVVDGGRVEGVGRLAELDHHVVARVDDVAHRPHARRLQPHLDAVGGRAYRQSVDHPADEARAELLLDNFHVEQGPNLWTLLVDVDRRPAYGGARSRRHLPRQADEREGVAAVRLDVHIEDNVSVELRD